MKASAYCIVSETTEDRFGETESLEDAVRIAQRAASESQTGDRICIEYRGRVIRQFLFQPDGRVAEEVIG